MTHYDALQYFEYQEYSADVRYAEIIRIILVSLFFSYLLPLTGILGLLGIIVTSHYYFSILIYFSKRPMKIDEMLPIKLLHDFYPLCIFIFGLGNYKTEELVYQTVHPITQLTLVISIFAYIVPIDWITSVIQP